ncbi:transglycosylase SLT domain-containing protein [Candidatus Contendibacter odensensis]|uniref:Lytic transglycosylase catalytic n=1 Tax=Candidatus Contendobacter odensis Run_B_J11 TaxID=1400861 RepID=A0A7U7GA18_9GAMM|nr:transglycosylase SLT domain-containing protein [Candidatus Contendobacter odensis]MBK8753555.1 transglycosylase SLT domain-containing protein [Candidatus Competibacteraceae bacterium]CDH44426.1 putative Lytic transglycosylase catalytic [Candidatus Contendobacter odensis Run_B_J11]
MNQRRSRRGASYLNPAGTPSGSGWRLPRRGWIPLLVAMLTIGIGGDASATESLSAWREAFQNADQALRNGVSVDYASLRTYPLYPYLRYQELSRRLPELPAAEVREFLQTYADSPLAERLRGIWLRQLATARRWDDYGRDAVPSRDPELDCWRRQALLNSGQKESALLGFSTLWLRGTALPVACDPVITVWRSQGGITPELLWQRFALAMDRNSLGLAKTLREAMPAADRKLADHWLVIADDPPRLLENGRFDFSDPRTGLIVSDGLERWGKRDGLAAAAALDTLKQRDPQLAPRLVEVERWLALWIASDYHPTALARLAAVPDTMVDRDVREWRVRICLRQGDWPAALYWLDQLPAEERDSPRWQYWRGRTLEALGRVEEAKPIYQSIAQQRDYHGFLAADRLSTPYAIPSTPLTIPATELDALLTGSPGLQRARELYILGRELEADAEWRQATQGFDRPALQQAAVLAHRWDWHPQAIATISRAEHWDDLELRFPLAYREGVINNARTDTVDPAWVYAVIRQESSFRPDARSPVGALGLMQIMPATGRQIAQELRDVSADNPPLLRPDINIRYGVHYLRQILERLQDNPMLATAAYNAGPNKVAQWLPARDTVPADVWAETIPYRETRSYVQRVMEYAAIYQRRLGAQSPETTLGARMKPVLPPEATRPNG